MAEKLPDAPQDSARILDWARNFTVATQRVVDRLDAEKFAYPLGQQIFNRHTVSQVTAAGTSQATAAALITEWTELSVGTSGSGGGALDNAYPGRQQVVFNPGTANVTVYPQTGERIGTAGTNAGVTVGIGTVANFRAITAGLWSMARGN